MKGSGARVAMAGIAVTGALTPKSAESGKSVDPDISGIKAPVIQEFNDLSQAEENTKYEMLTPPHPATEVNVEVFSEEITPEQRNEMIKKEGGIVLDGSQALKFTVNPNELGATDQYGNYYPSAIGEGATITVGNTNISITYENKEKREIGFAVSNQGTGQEIGKVGQVLGEIYTLPDSAMGKVIHLSNYTESLPGDAGIDVRIARSEGKEVVLIPVLLSGISTNVLPPEAYIDENGTPKLVVRVSKGAPVEKSGYLQSDEAYVGLLVANFIVIEEGNHQLQILGYARNPSIRADGIYIENMSQNLKGKSGL